MNDLGRAPATTLYVFPITLVFDLACVTLPIVGIADSKEDCQLGYCI